MLQSITYSSFKPGPKLLVLGAVHGNETCGTYAIRRVLRELEEKTISVKTGSATFIPVCNPRAFKAKARFVDRNLNRFLFPREKPRSYEEQIGNELCSIIAQCTVLLDLHSYEIGGPPFVFIGRPNTPEHDLAKSLGTGFGIVGWSEAYAASGGPAGKIDPEECCGTTEYARNRGAMALTLECGQTDDPDTVDVAYRGIRKTLAHLGMLRAANCKASKDSLKLIDVKKVFYRNEGGSLTKNWRHLEKIAAGTVVAKDGAGNDLMVPDDGYIIMPNATAPVQTEWFYWGQDRA
ncbi:MAG: succinylglutamate desuccinylase/aspartoacylase family protein [Alphaproteobacteria bacterium]|nr:succinylglutamate desuccinylase/aspartoacylase family protein [Alphaproteobacteria bacterium]